MGAFAISAILQTLSGNFHVDFHLHIYPYITSFGEGIVDLQPVNNEVGIAAGTFHSILLQAIRRATGFRV